MSLKKQAGKGFAWDLSGTIAKQGISFTISIFLARLLEPKEFGLIGMALVFISIFQVFSDLGLGSALIQNKKNSSRIYSSVFYVNVISGFILCGIFQLSAPLIAGFFENDQLTPLIRLLSLSFVITSFDIVQKSIMSREINFKTLNIITIISQVTGGVVAVILAFQGIGVYALVVQNLLAALTNVTLLWIFGNWFPKLEFSWKEIQNLISFSAFMLFEGLLTRASNQLDVFFVGKMFSPSTLGFYTRAQSLDRVVTQFSSSSFSKIFFPVLSKYQDDNSNFMRIYFQVISIVCFLAFLNTGLIVFWGDTIIVTLFGEKWRPSVFIFQLLMLQSFVYPISAMMINALISKGKSKENFYIGLLRKAARLFPIIIGFYHGLEAFLISLVIVNYILTVVNILFMKSILNISIWPHFKKIFEGAIILFPFIFFYFYFDIYNDEILNSLIYSVLFVVTYLLWSWLIKNEGLIFLKNNLSLQKLKQR